MNVCIIPARGGSKRIPRKNIKEFCGKPIIAYPIEAAQKSGLFERIIVSTDDSEIAEVAASFGAEIPFMRPKELSDDFTGTTPVIAHAIRELENGGANIDIACCVYATSAFLTPKLLKDGFEALADGKEYSFSVSDFAAPIFRSFKLTEGGGVEMFFPEHFGTRSQDLPVAYHDAAQFYFGRKDAFLNNLPIFALHSAAVKVDRHLVQDIDTLNDWDIAERLFRTFFC
ncbi:MAG: pseudaminic acid cytidylyltransferase [Campylobacterales bacterium]|nr:pseudaminic acid cytidylyltransferase [Campylobacterales bacterium]